MVQSVQRVQRLPPDCFRTLFLGHEMIDGTGNEKTVVLPHKIFPQTSVGIFVLIQDLRLKSNLIIPEVNCFAF